MSTSREFTKEERRALLYLESQCVDNRGYVDILCMGRYDVQIAGRWDKEGYIKFGRLRVHAIKGDYFHAVRLSDQAWADVAVLRRRRALQAGPLLDDDLCGTRLPHEVTS